VRMPFVSLVALLVATMAHAQAPAPARKGPVEMNASDTPGKATAKRAIHGTGTVTAIDVAGRSITLKNSSGATRTFKVGPDVKRLDEIAVGDLITIDYEQGLALEFQPVGSETVPPKATATGARGETDQAPGGTAAAGVTGTVTVTAIDMEKRLVSFQGPAGKVYQVKAGPKIKLDKLKVGDRLLATYVEAVAIKLEKPGK
jgi:Cu/Ag efflux protein CusF